MSLFDQTGRWTDVHGSQLRALERNLVRYRSYQIVLFLQKSEALKEALEDLGDGIAERVKLSDKSGEIPNHLTKAEWRKMPPWRRVCERLFGRSLLGEEMRDSIVELIGYRNAIAHEVEFLYGDIGTARNNREFAKYPEYYPSRFEYRNLDRILEVAEYFEREISPRFVMTLRLKRMVFGSVEKFLTGELKRLKPIIERQIASRRAEMKAVRDEIAKHSKGWDWRNGFYPRHPEYRYRNGRLTDRGMRACEGLFADGLSDRACAYLLDLSIKSVRSRRRRWEGAFGRPA